MGDMSKTPTSDNPAWPTYRTLLLAALKGLPPPVAEAQLQIAYNRMHGIANSPELLRAARTGTLPLVEWPTGRSNDEFL